MRTVYKYPFHHARYVTLTLPAGAVILTCACQNGGWMCWAEIDPLVETTELRKLRVIGTGHALTDELEPPKTYRYITTIFDDCFVFHIYEVNNA